MSEQLSESTGRTSKIRKYYDQYSRANLLKSIPVLLSAVALAGCSSNKDNQTITEKAPDLPVVQIGKLQYGLKEPIPGRGFPGYKTGKGDATFKVNLGPIFASVDGQTINVERDQKLLLGVNMNCDKRKSDSGLEGAVVSIDENAVKNFGSYRCQDSQYNVSTAPGGDPFLTQDTVTVRVDAINDKTTWAVGLGIWDKR